MIIWLTGLPCSGKTTIAQEIHKKIESEILDGDELRNSIFSQNIGFSKEEREQHLLRVGFLAQKLSIYTNVICSFVSPYEETRLKIPFDFLVYVKCPVEVCVERDVKGMYKLAKEGKIKNFTGLTAPYEEPKYPDLVVETNVLTLNQCVEKILTATGLKDFYCI